MDQHEGTQRNPVNPNTGNEHITSNPPPATRSLDPSIQVGPGDLAPGDEPLTIRQWFAQNAFTLVVVLSVIGLIVTKFDTEGIIAIGKAALGLSFVIFIHELGHFLVAKWCDVHVTVFSIGFGPALPGCRYQWGETTYKIALFPLGGYVQMVGQVDGDESSDGSDDDPRSYRNKSVPQRMAIISAGVIMNVILAVICFIVVFQGPGKDRPAAVISYMDTGAPAFKKGLHTGWAFEQVGDIRNPHFEDLMRTVMGSTHGESVYFEARDPNHPTRVLKTEIVPRKEEDDAKPVIGIIPSDRLELVRRKFVDPNETVPAWSFTAAARATPAFAFGDRIIAMTDPNDPKKVTDLPDDPRFPGHGQRDYFEFVRRMQLLAGKEVVIRVERKKDEETKQIDITVPPAFHYTLGVRMHMGPIAALREGSPAAAAGIIVRDKDKKVPGDLIEAVSYQDKDGKTVTLPKEKESLDPLRLPDDLRKALANVDGPKKVTLHLRRLRAGPGEQNETVKVELDWQPEWSFDRAVPMGASSPWAIPELGLAYLVKSTVAEAPEDSPLQKWDDIKEVQIIYRTAEDDNKEGTALKLDSDEQFAYAFFSNFVNFAGPPVIQKVKLKVERNKKIEEIELTPVLDQTWPIAERGLIFMRDLRRQKADNFYGAVALGLKDTHNSMMQVFQTIRGMVLRRLSPKNLGGPITIANVAYRYAGIDFWEFIFFLGLISVNLAVINFLPIPVLDGGHMVFLLYELVRGKPASEGVRAGATYAGLALILCLMIFVFYLDITRQLF